MKVSFSILVDLFKNLNVSVKYYKNSYFDDYRLYSEKDFIKASYIYVCTITEFSKISNKGNGSFIVLDPENILEKTKLDKNYNIIIIKDEIPPNLIINTINSFFTNFRSFENSILKYIYEEKPLDFIIEQIEKNLQLKLSINDASGSVLYKNFKADLVKLKSLSYHSDDKLIGSLSLYDNKIQLKRTQLDIFDGLTGYISPILEEYFNEQYRASQMLAIYLFRNIIQGASIKNKDLDILDELSWNRDDDFLMLLLKDLSNESEESLASLIENSYKNSALISKSENEYIIFANTSKLEKEVFVSETIHLIEKDSSALLIISKPFANILGAKDIYDFLHKLSSKLISGIFDLEKDLFTILVRSMEIDDNFINENILKLKNYDEENDDNLLETLYTFLIYERSYVKAAEMLNVHRNTVVYRINKIEGIVDLDLDDAHTRLHSILSALMIDKDFYKYD